MNALFETRYQAAERQRVIIGIIYQQLLYCCAKMKEGSHKPFLSCSLKSRRIKILCVKLAIQVKIARAREKSALKNRLMQKSPIFFEDIRETFAES